MLIHNFKKKSAISTAALISIIALTLTSLHIDFINAASAKAENEVWATLEVHIRFPNGTIVKFGPIRIRYILLYKTERGEVWVPAEEVPTLNSRTQSDSVVQIQGRYAFTELSWMAKC